MTTKKQNELVSEPNYHATKLLAAYLGLSFLEIWKIIVHNYWCDWLHKTKYGKMANLCYMDTDNLIVYVESKDICTDLTGNNKKRIWHI